MRIFPEGGSDGDPKRMLHTGMMRYAAMERAQDKTIKKFNSRMQAKLLLVFCVITLLLFGLMGRLVYIMQTRGDQYTKSVLSKQTYVSKVLPYKRGDITDRNGTVLARSELQYRLILNPRLLLEDKQECIDVTQLALQESFAVTQEEFNKILEEKSDKQYVIVRKKLKHEDVKSFEAKVEAHNKVKGNKAISGVTFEEEYVRSYPYGALACDILGFTSADDTGYWGIEEYYNRELNGTNGREYGYYDADLNIERIIKKAVNGNTVISTIDANAQRIIQKHIAQFNKDFGSLSIGVLIMDPNNGEIIAMASNQEYDLNNPRNLEGILSETELAGMSEEEKTEALNAMWKNDVITSGFEPGSTFKPITIAAGMEEGTLSEDDHFFCDGSENILGVPIACSNKRGHGDLNLTQTLMKSCNDALMQIVDREGRDIFYRYQNSFGFGRKTGIDLPGEGTGITMTKDALNPVELATNSFGQGFTVTMVQLAAAYSSLVNGGYYYQPHIVKKIVNANGATVTETDKLLVRQTVSEKTSDFIQNAMYLTVEEGTAQGAKVEGYAVGGKTGTAQKLPRAAKTYVVSFVGAVPAINPEIVIYVMIDEPQNVEKQADSSIATTFASRIMKELLPALGIYPDGEIDYLLPSEENTGENAGSSQGENTQGNTSGEGNTQGGSSQGGDTQGNTPGEGGSQGSNAQGNTSGENNSQGDNSGEGTPQGNASPGNSSPDDGASETEPSDNSGEGLPSEGETGLPEEEGEGIPAEGGTPGEEGISYEDEFNADALSD